MQNRHNRPLRTGLLLATAAATLALAGCYTYPAGYYRPAPAPVQRLTPEQAAAIQTNSQLSQADRDRLTRDNALVAQQDANAAYAPAYAPTYAPGYSYPAPTYYDPYYYGYPYYGGFYPFYPSIGLSFGFRGGFRGGGFHGGGFHGHR
jgi:hypothetical protein